MPGRDEGFAPERPGSSSREDLAKQRADAARLTDAELRERLAEAENLGGLDLPSARARAKAQHRVPTSPKNLEPVADLPFE